MKNKDEAIPQDLTIVLSQFVGLADDRIIILNEIERLRQALDSRQEEFEEMKTKYLKHYKEKKQITTKVFELMDFSVHWPHKEFKVLFEALQKNGDQKNELLKTLMPDSSKEESFKFILDSAVQAKMPFNQNTIDKPLNAIELPDTETIDNNETLDIKQDENLSDLDKLDMAISHTIKKQKGAKIDENDT